MLNFFSRKPTSSTDATPTSSTDATPVDGSFCIHAFKSIEIMPTGLVKPCCSFSKHVQAEGRDMSVYEYSLEAIWNSDMMQEMRQAMVDGMPVESCKLCYRQEQQGLTSIRAHSNQVFQMGYLNEEGETINAVKHNARRHGFKLPLGPSYLELAVGNLCNLKCRMCYTGYSSAISADPVHSKWSSSAALARWNGLTASVAPRRVIGAAYSGFLEQDVGVAATLWTDGDASIRLNFLTSSLVGIQVRISATKPDNHPLRITANGETLFQGELPSGAWSGKFNLDFPTDGGQLELRFQSPLFALQPDGDTVGVGIDDISIVRAESGRSHVVSSRLATSAQWFQDSDFRSEIVGDHKNLKRIYLIGGEPLLIKEVRILLTSLIESGAASSIILAFTTNGTVLDDEWLLLCRNFRRIEVGISIDGVGRANEYIRYPSSWVKITENLKRYRLEPKFNVELSLTIQAYNFLILTEIFEFAMEEGIPLRFLFLDNPRIMNAFAMPLLVREKAISRLHAFLANHPSDTVSTGNLCAAKQVADALENCESDLFSEGTLRSFMVFTNDLDSSRQQDIRAVFPDLIDLLTNAGYPWIDDRKFT